MKVGFKVIVLISLGILALAWLSCPTPGICNDIDKCFDQCDRMENQPGKTENDITDCYNRCYRRHDRPKEQTQSAPDNYNSCIIKCSGIQVTSQLTKQYYDECCQKCARKYEGRGQSPTTQDTKQSERKSVPKLQPGPTTQPVKTASPDSSLPDSRRVESQVSGGASSVSPCEAVKQYMAKYVAIWRESGASTKPRCGGKTMDSSDLTVEDVDCLRRAAIEDHNRMMSRLQGTTDDRLQRQLADLKHRYEQVLKSKPMVWVSLQSWEQSVVICFERKTEGDCSGLREFSQDILRLCKTQ